MPGDGLFGPIVTTDAFADLTGDRAWLQAMLDAEAALAAALADVGVVPRAAADAIARVGDASRFVPAELGRAARLGGNPVIPLVDALRAQLPADAARWVHWGATSQDIMDTSQMLVARRALDPILAGLGDLADGCAVLARRHRRTLMAGRTLLQQALPITFGLKAAGWLTGVVDCRPPLVAAGDRLAVELGGAAGTLASLGPDGPAVAARMAVRLGLAEPTMPWHSHRQRVVALGSALATATGTAAKISLDVALLMQTEIAEVAEPAAAGRGGSSTLPHKRNPVGAAAVSTAARTTQALVPVLLGSLVAEHERGLGGWPAEWETLSRLLALTGGAVTRTAETVTGLEVDADAMAAGLARTGGLVLAERVSLALARRVDDPARGRQAVTDAAGRALAGPRDFRDELLADPVVAAALSAEDLDELLDPSGYLGATEVWIDRALAAHERSRPPRPA